jgi:outer membrane protein assembly factor BamB
MIYCVDMRTGDTLWNVPGSFDVGSRRGQTAALYSFSNNRFIAYDAITGGLILNVTGMSMAFYQEPYVYSTVVGPERGQLGNLRFIKWDTSGTSNDFSTRILYNISIPYDLFVPWSIILSQNYLLSFAFEYPTSAATRMAAWNLTNGQLVYDVPIANVSDPNSWVIHLTPMGTGQGKLWLAGSPIENEGIGYVAFDVDTGKFAWTMEKPGDPWGNFWAYTPQANAYGMIYGLSYSGVYAINSTNGKIVWHYIANDTYSEEPYNSNIDPTTGQSYGSYSFGSIGAKIGGGVVFAPSSEHSPTFIYRGQSMYAIDAFTGKEIWSIKGAYSPCAVAYGILLAADTYNGVSYAFGKGDSATTVGVSSEVIPRSGTVLIKGSVLDMSTAQQGTPAIADQFQTAWMEYLHMQQPKPTNATGVPVVLTAVDATGKSTTIGTVTSDANGQYAFAWAPQTEGTYTIVASFGGSESYYASSAETAVAVSPAAAGSSVSPQPSTPSTSTSPSVSTSPSTSVSPNAPVSESPAVSPTQAPPSNEPIPTNTYLAIAAAVVIIAVLAAAIVLRKRKQ